MLTRLWLGFKSSPPRPKFFFFFLLFPRTLPVFFPLTCTWGPTGGEVSPKGTPPSPFEAPQQRAIALFFFFFPSPLTGAFSLPYRFLRLSWRRWYGPGSEHQLLFCEKKSSLFQEGFSSTSGAARARVGKKTSVRHVGVEKDYGRKRLRFLTYSGVF